jgi:hypothetical protein
VHTDRSTDDADAADAYGAAGDHSISLPILRAIAREQPLGMVHIDAHCGTGDDYLGSRFHHGASFRLDPSRVRGRPPPNTFVERTAFGAS